MSISGTRPFSVQELDFVMLGFARKKEGSGRGIQYYKKAKVNKHFLQNILGFHMASE